MILDKLNQVMTAYAPTATSATFQDYIDRLVAMDDGAGTDIDVFIQNTVQVTSAGAATVQFQVIGNATDPTFASGNVVLFDSGALGKATLIPGYQIRGTIKRADMAGSYEKKTAFLRYATILVTIGTATLTAGTFNGWLLNEGIQDNLSYAAGYTV